MLMLTATVMSPAGNSEILLPILAITGIVSLLLALTVVAILFAKFGLADKAQALGMPEGSVRAVIALALVVLFAIISVYLYRSFADGCKEVARFQVPNQESANALVQAAAQPSSSFDVLVIPPAKGQSGPYLVIYSARVSREASEFAKQLLILIGTLVTSVASFYFGARTVASAQDAMAALAAISITSLTPDQVQSSVGTAQVTVLGTGLNRVKSVKLATATQSIDGTLLQKSDCALVCTFPIGATAAGDWELVVAADGETARHAFKINQANAVVPPPQNPAPAPVIPPVPPV